MLNEARIESGVSSVVRSTIVRESPSTPKWKEAFKDGYQSIFSKYWKPACSDLKPNHRTRDKPNGTRLPRKADHRSSFFSPFGRKINTNAIIVGENKINERIDENSILPPREQ